MARKPKKREPRGYPCRCGHLGGTPGSKHAGGTHGIMVGFGPCTAARCRCKRFVAKGNGQVTDAK